MLEVAKAEHQHLIMTKIRSLLPHAQVLVFGSRVRGDAKPYSDLDIALDTGGPISLVLLGQLKESFAQSDIPYQIDLVDLQNVDSEFEKIIRESSVVW